MQKGDKTMSNMHAPHHVRSADGSRIAYSRSGDGPALILVEAAGHYRDFSSYSGLARLLSRELTVYTYDRRGRGASTETAPYAPQREVEDLDALIAHAGGSAHLYGFSSGALLAVRAAAHGLSVDRLAVMEPPLQDEDAGPDPLTAELRKLVAAGRNGDVVECFHQSIGVPSELIDDMRSTPPWSKMASVAHTFVYDCILSDTTTTALLGSVEVPTLVLDSEGSTDNLTTWSATVAHRLPHGRHRSLAGEWHSVPDEILAPVLVEFFGGLA